MVEIAESTNERTTDLREAIEKHFALFQGLASLAKQLLLEREYETSAAYVQVAAHYAWFHPIGLFASPELEAILTQIGAALDPVASGPARIAPVPPRKVLHVLTEVYPLGGHTRLVWRWIQADAGRTHSVVLTRQYDGEVPQPLKAAAEGTGGKLYFLDRQAGGLLGRAQALRRLAVGADHVVLHTYPYDVVPLIAFAQKEARPPLTLMNKDDHVFWLGGSVADQVAQMRYSGWRLSQQRRGTPEARCVLLPIPLEVKRRTLSRGEAKKQLGLPENAVVLVSVASAYKYSSPGGQHFAEVLLPVIQEKKNAMLLVVGPEQRDEWASASLQAAGRIKAFGKRGDVDIFYQAADVYLDSFPFGSLTSLLEAGSYGTPLVSYRANSSEPELMCEYDPGLSDLPARPNRVDDYRNQVCRFIDDAQLRARLGEQTRESITAHHGRSGWKRLLEELYLCRGVLSSADAWNGASISRMVTDFDIHLAQVYMTSGLSRPFPKVIRNHVGLFPLKARVGIWWNIFGHEWHFLPVFLLSDWQKTKLRLLWSRP